VKRLEAWKLYVLGWTYREIAAEINMSAAQVCNYINDTIKEIAEENKISGKDYIKAEIERLDMMLKYWMPKVQDNPEAIGNPADTATHNVIKIMERRTKYLGLDQPAQVEHSGTVSLVDMITQSMGKKADEDK
jgi:hypothetical protein